LGVFAVADTLARLGTTWRIAVEWRFAFHSAIWERYIVDAAPEAGSAETGHGITMELKAQDEAT